MTSERFEQSATKIEAPHSRGLESQALARPDVQPSRSENAAEWKINSLNLEDKMSLSPEQSDSLRKVESGILKGDLKSVEKNLQQYKNNPDAAKSLMDVLAKDLKSAGISADYDVDPSDSSQGGPARTGKLGLSTVSLLDYETKEGKHVTMSTNPAEASFAGHDTPRPATGNIRSPYHETIEAKDALASVGATAVNNLLSTKH